MKNKLVRVLVAIFTLGIIVSYNDCTSNYVFNSGGIKTQGTNTGNPLSPASFQILFSVCEIINRCNPQVSYSECQAGVLASTINTQVGAPSTYGTFSSVAQGESAGNLIANQGALDICSAGINVLSCSDPQVQGAYDPSAANPFVGASYMIPNQACGNVFSTPVQYGCSSKVFLRGAPNTSLAPLASGAGQSYSISPPLPAGLTLDSVTGIISGTPTVVTPFSSYTVTASSAVGTSTSTVSIKTADGYLVTDLGDTPDQAGADGLCSTATGTCTLRAAIMQANSSGGAAIHEIVVPAGTITVGSLLSISSNLEIVGACQSATIVDGKNTSPIFDVAANNLNISLQSLKIQNGNTSGTGGGFNGGFNTGLVVNLSRIYFYNNFASGANGGGAVYFGAVPTFNCTDCVFDSNKTPNEGGGFNMQAGPNFQRTLFVNNSASNGAAGYVFAGPSTFTNNTFYGNSSTANGAGALYFNAGTTHTLMNNTFANNSVSAAGPGAISSSGGVVVTITNTLFSNNTGSSAPCGVSTVTSGGGNLGYPNFGGCVFNRPTDITSAPLLGSLQNNGGFTNTMALLPNSPAIDSGIIAGCPLSDQRNLPRQSDGKCDIGAFEVQ